jgi:hypothetical protein
MCAKRTGELAVGELYKLMELGGVDVPFADFVWGGFAPSKAKFFAWLLVQSRIQSRAALFKKHVLSEDEAICPICESERETATHLIFGCPFVRRFWDAIDRSFPVDVDVRRLFSYDTPAPRGSKATSTLTILLCWNIWKHRNGVAFRGESASLPRLLSMCREEVALWELRAPATLHDEAVAWTSHLALCKMLVHAAALSPTPCVSLFLSISPAVETWPLEPVGNTNSGGDPLPPGEKKIHVA